MVWLEAATLPKISAVSWILSHHVEPSTLNARPTTISLWSVFPLIATWRRLNPHSITSALPRWREGLRDSFVNRYLLSTYCVPSIVASTGDIAEKEEILFSKELLLGGTRVWIRSLQKSSNLTTPFAKGPQGPESGRACSELPKAWTGSPAL